MEATLGFCLALACVDGANASLHFSHLPPYGACRAACQASQAEYFALTEAVPFAEWYCSHQAAAVRSARDAAYRKWDAWHWAVGLRSWPPLDPRSLDNYEHRLKCLIGEENYSLGALPWPNSWR